jgi:hypothetical protein
MHSVIFCRWLSSLLCMLSRVLHQSRTVAGHEQLIHICFSTKCFVLGSFSRVMRMFICETWMQINHKARVTIHVWLFKFLAAIRSASLCPTWISTSWTSWDPSSPRPWRSSAAWVLASTPRHQHVLYVLTEAWLAWRHNLHLEIMQRTPTALTDFSAIPSNNMAQLD